MGTLKNDEVKFSKKPIPMSFDTLYNDTGRDYYKEFNYTPNMKRPISIIDPETGNEVKPVHIMIVQQMKLKENVN